MEQFRLKLKVGVHEFEAEGDQVTVERQLAVWREMIGSMPVGPPALASPPPVQVIAPAGIPSGERFGTPQLVEPVIRADLDRLFDHRGRILTLTMLPNGEHRVADAALLILLGQKEYNGADLVTGGQINEGLKLSGLPVERIDRGWGPHMDVNVTRVGSRRGVKYRLTNPGLARARAIARELIAMAA